MKTFSFEKWHGIGNDFILVSEKELSLTTARSLAPKLCDRNFGIGADGLLVVGDGPRMHVINADGSEPEMCGNGIRCVAGWFVKREKLASSGKLIINTDSGPKACFYQQKSPKHVLVEVDMGKVSFSPKDSGVNEKDTEKKKGLIPFSELTTPLFGTGTVTSVGNPHWIFMDCDNLNEFREQARLLEKDPRFENQTNVSFVTKTNINEFTTVVWERGVGFTLACGTASTAVAAVAVVQRLALQNTPIQIVLPGGTLSIVIDEDWKAKMTGPAEYVFSGKI